MPPRPRLPRTSAKESSAYDPVTGLRFRNSRETLRNLPPHCAIYTFMRARRSQPPKNFFNINLKEYTKGRCERCRWCFCQTRAKLCSWRASLSRTQSVAGASWFGFSSLVHRRRGRRVGNNRLFALAVLRAAGLEPPRHDRPRTAA